jgi:hemerythrin superfamily protein
MFLSANDKENLMLIYEALKNDHEKVKTLLNDLVALEASNEDRRHSLIENIRDELIPHSRAEESVFYNSLRAIDSAKDIVMHGFEEHMEAETLLRSLQVADKIDLEWKATAQKLKKALEHHIQEEEGKIFNVAQQLFTKEEAEMMAEAFEQLKPEVKEEGFLRTTLDMVANLMPPRFAASLRTFTLNPRV